VAKRHTLPASDDSATLAEMIGAVIYVRVSTKEQTENLSLPTQLRACEEYCRRQGYEILERSTKRARAPRPRIGRSSRRC
jgi:DNA invertase Pin-like site-specific DNA recombinase